MAAHPYCLIADEEINPMLPDMHAHLHMTGSSKVTQSLYVSLRLIIRNVHIAGNQRHWVLSEDKAFTQCLTSPN